MVISMLDRRRHLTKTSLSGQEGHHFIHNLLESIQHGLMDQYPGSLRKLWTFFWATVGPAMSGNYPERAGAL